LVDRAVFVGVLVAGAIGAVLVGEADGVEVARAGVLVAVAVAVAVAVGVLAGMASRPPYRL
jgi:uncharacterized membrane protein YebE (DUF533 family)